MADSAVAGTDKLWNPTAGRDHLALGREIGYAMALAKRLELIWQAKHQTDAYIPTSGPGL